MWWTHTHTQWDCVSRRKEKKPVKCICHRESFLDLNDDCIHNQTSFRQRNNYSQILYSRTANISTDAQGRPGTNGGSLLIRHCKIKRRRLTFMPTEKGEFRDTGIKKSNHSLLEQHCCYRESHQHISPILHVLSPDWLASTFRRLQVEVIITLYRGYNLRFLGSSSERHSSHD